MQRLLMLAAVLALTGGLAAQGMGEDPPAPKNEPTEEPKEAPKEAPKGEPKKEEAPQRPARERPGRAERPGAAAPAVDRKVLEEEFKALDRDDDGKLTKEELGDRRVAMLESHDADKNGSLDLEEWIKARNAAPQRPARERGDRPQPGDAFKNMDKDADGKISKDEAGPRIKEQFDAWDTDKDGSLSREEFDKGMATMRRPAGERRPQGERRPGGGEPKESPKETPGEAPKETPKEAPKEMD